MRFNYQTVAPDKGCRLAELYCGKSIKCVDCPFIECMKLKRKGKFNLTKEYLSRYAKK